MSTPASERVRIRRGARKARYERATMQEILDRGLVGHVAFANHGDVFCVPMLYARVGERVYVHGSSASRTIRALAAGAHCCLAVTLLDGIVLARSAFEHSANYESVVAFGRFTAVTDMSERMAALEAFTEKLVPGRWGEVRAPSRQELKGTAILGMPLDEAAAKCRSGPPDDDDTPDAEIDTWAGVIPMITSFGTPVASPGLTPGTALSESVSRLLAHGGDRKERGN